MNQEQVDWRSGRVVFWDLDSVDEARPLSDQLLELKEDLAQIEYSGGIVLDVGWYPESCECGNFTVVVSRAGEWDQPLMQERCHTVKALRVSLGRAVRLAEEAAK